MSRPLKVLICSTPISDHVAAAAPVASALAARGHHVRWYTGREFWPTVEGAGAVWQPIVAGHDPLERAAGKRFGLEHRCLDEAPHQLADLRRIDDEVRFDLAVVDTDFTAGLMWEQLSGMPFATYGAAFPPRPSRRAGRHKLQRHHNEIRVRVGLPATPVTVFDAAISPYLHVQDGTVPSGNPRRSVPAHVHFVTTAVACDLVEQLGITQQRVVGRIVPEPVRPGGVKVSGIRRRP